MAPLLPFLFSFFSSCHQPQSRLPAATITLSSQSPHWSDNLMYRENTKDEQRVKIKKKKEREKTNLNLMSSFIKIDFCL